MAADEKITIFFDAKGDKKLISAINALARSQGRLHAANKKSVASGMRMTKNNEKQRKSFIALGGTMSVIRSKLLVWAFALQLVNKVVGTFIRLAMKQEDAEKRLAQQLGRTSKELLNHASNLQKVTAFGDEEILAVHGQMAAYTKEEETIKKLTEATLELADGKGIDLATAGDLVSKSFGSSTNALQRYGIGVKGAANSTRRLESLTENVDRLYEGMSTTIDTTSKALKQMKNALGDAGEEIGKAFLPLTKRTAISLTRFTQESLIPFIEKVKKIDFSQTFTNIKNNMEEVVKFVAGILALWPKAAVVIGGKMTNAFINHFILPLAEAFENIDFGGLFFEIGKSALLGIAKLIGLILNDISKFLTETLVGAFNKIIRLIKKTMPKISDAIGIEIIKMEDVVAPQFNLDWIDEKLMESARTIGENPLFQFFKETFNTDIFDMESLIGAFSDNYKETIGKLIAWQEEQVEDDGDGNFLTRVFGMTDDELSNMINNWQMYQTAIMDVANAYEKLKMQEMDQARQAELDTVKGIRNERVKARKMEEINEKFDAKAKALKRDMQKIRIAEAISNTALGITKAFADPGGVPGWIMSGLIAVAGALQVATIKSQKFASGGLVGGMLHSAGGTPIEAERGEFVMRRSAVEAIGVETMNRINQGGGAGNINISFAGNVLSDDFIESEAVPKIKEALRRGGSIE